VPIHFLEVQFQKDEEFYSRLFTEIFIYLRQKKPKNDWQVTVVYARRSLETEEPIWYREFFNSPRLKRIYLDEELDWVKSPTVGIGAVQLIVSPEKKAVESAKELIERTKQTVSDPASQEDLIKFIETIIIYKLPQKSREELEAMFGLSELKQTKVYQEALAEGEAKGKAEGKAEGEVKGEVKAKLKAVPRLLKLGLTVKQIAKALELPLEQVQQIAAEND